MACATSRDPNMDRLMVGGDDPALETQTHPADASCGSAPRFIDDEQRIASMHTTTDRQKLDG